jgi:hypothetical protein
MTGLVGKSPPVVVERKEFVAVCADPPDFRPT